MIAVIKYNAGNVKSMGNALDRLGVEWVLTDNPEEIKKADKVIFPGVGEASTAMKYLKEKGLDELIRNLHQPFLGVCLGLQLMCSYSEENDVECIGVFKERVKRFPDTLKVPQMGWNNLSDLKGSLMKGVRESEDFYFVHSYYAEVGKDTIATCNYSVPFSAALNKDNFYAVQFHPEKSGDVGAKVLQNFCEL